MEQIDHLTKLHKTKEHPMNKKFCFQLLINLSLGLSICVPCAGISIDPLKIDGDNYFFYPIDGEQPKTPSTLPVSNPPVNQTKETSPTLNSANSAPSTAITPANSISDPSTTPAASTPDAPAASPNLAAPDPEQNASPQTITPGAEPLPQAGATQLPVSPTLQGINPGAPATNAPASAPAPNLPPLNPPASDVQFIKSAVAPEADLKKTILINFNNIDIIEYIRFISRISGKNFVFDENELQFNVTIVSEEPTSLENIMTALLQELRIRDLSILEEGNNLIIHRNPKVNNISTIVDDDTDFSKPSRAQIITQVFRLNTVDAEKAAAVVKPLTSAAALIEVLKDTNHLIITDLAANLQQIGNLLRSIDSPKSGLVIGQYAIKQGIPDALIDLTQKIMQPIAGEQQITLISHPISNSIFIIATPYLVERTMSIMQYLDQTQGSTQILNFKDMKYQQGQNGKWALDPTSNWRYATKIKGDNSPNGSWALDGSGDWIFTPASGDGANSEAGGPAGGAANRQTPEGEWAKDADGNWMFELAPGKQINPAKVTRPNLENNDLPVGHIERTKFFIYKLNYRQASLIEQAIRKIGISLKLTNTNADLVAAIDSIQSIDATNSLIFTGTYSSIEKMKELIEEVDRPLRQVFLELLILEVSLADSMTFAVNWASGFGGGSSAGAQAFLSAGSPLAAAMGTTIAPNRPVASGLAASPGFSLGVLGQHLTRGGVLFNSIGALVSAIHNNSRQNVVLNPKILTEDNSPAEIFVGLNTQFPTQAIANNNGNILTQNFEYRDVGTRFKVTPLIGAGDMITLDIEEEKTAIIPNPNPNITTQQQNIVLGPSVSKSRTTTRVHMPDGYFLILSGQIEDVVTWTRNQIPCIGGIPIIGAAFGERRRSVTKTNLMLFIQPRIVDTYEQMQDLTKHQQDIWKQKNRLRKSWKYEAHEALDFLNLKDEFYPKYDTGDCECE